jgi:hypothetical protein
MFHSDEERANHALDAIKVFQEIAKSSLDNVIQWRESLTKLISIFILQWTSKNRQFREIECVSLFGSMLSGLYSNSK